LRSTWGEDYFEIAVEDVEGVQGLESDNCLDEYAPDLALLEQLLALLMIDYLLVEVSIVGELHDDAASEVTYHKFLP
jgi:hypothetical protein